MKRIFATNRLMNVLAAALLTAAVCPAQATPAKKALMFHGKVEAVNETAKSLKMNGEQVEGWMDAIDSEDLRLVPRSWRRSTKATWCCTKWRSCRRRTK